MTDASKARKHAAATDGRVAAATVVLGAQYSAKASTPLQLMTGAYILSVLSL
jgi:hypothetical protein